MHRVPRCRGVINHARTQVLWLPWGGGGDFAAPIRIDLLIFSFIFYNNRGIVLLNFVSNHPFPFAFIKGIIKQVDEGLHA